MKLEREVKEMVLDELTSYEPILKGWSHDKKYRVISKDKKEYLLRISSNDKIERIETLFNILEKATCLELPICKPLEYKSCSEGVYALYTWINGKDAEDAIPLLSEEEQYELGYTSGMELKKIHSIPAPETQEEWEIHFNKKTDIKIKKYQECGYRFEGDEHIITYLLNNRDVIKNRPQSFQHGDYHTGNMMIKNNKLIIIDFDRYDFGDPWEEFNRIVWCAQLSPLFASGMINGYFKKTPDVMFWKCLAYYICSNTLSSIYWAIDFGETDLAVMINQSQDVLSWYDNFQTIVPNWYSSSGNN